jgi:hypothetical protein
VSVSPQRRAKFLFRWFRHAGAPLLRNTRKTERGAGQFLTDLEVRAAPFALLRNLYCDAGLSIS